MCKLFYLKTLYVGSILKVFVILLHSLELGRHVQRIPFILCLARWNVPGRACQSCAMEVRWTIRSCSSTVWCHLFFNFVFASSTVSSNCAPTSTVRKSVACCSHREEKDFKITQYRASNDSSRSGTYRCRSLLHYIQAGSSATPLDRIHVNNFLNITWLKGLRHPFFGLPHLYICVLECTREDKYTLLFINVTYHRVSTANGVSKLRVTLVRLKLGWLIITLYVTYGWLFRFTNINMFKNHWLQESTRKISSMIKHQIYRECFGLRTEPKSSHWKFDNENRERSYALAKNENR